MPRNWDENLDGLKDPEPSFSSSLSTEPPPQPVKFSLPQLGNDICALLPLYGEHQLDNLGIAVTITSLLLTQPSTVQAKLQDRVTRETIARGIKSVRWPGRLSFHTVSLGDPSQSLVVLEDGAHNPASSATLGAFVTHLLSLAKKDNVINITYILALSHSPSKTPLQTLSPILPPTLPPNSNLKLNITSHSCHSRPRKGCHG